MADWWQLVGVVVAVGGLTTGLVWRLHSIGMGAIKADREARHKLEARVDGIAEEIDSLDRRVDRLDTTVFGPTGANGMRARLKELGDRMHAVEQAVTAFEFSRGLVAGLDDRVREIEKRQQRGES